MQGLQRGEGTTGAWMAILLSPRLLFHLLSFTVEGKGRQEGRDSRKGQTERKRDARMGSSEGSQKEGERRQVELTRLHGGDSSGLSA